MAIMQNPTRFERGLAPYESPKKAWDAPAIGTPVGGMLQKVEPSSRAARRQRSRDLAAMGKKSRRTAFRQDFARRQAEASLRGIGRIWFRPVEGPTEAARFDNVDRQVLVMATRRMKETGKPLEEALDEVEGQLRDLLVAYGDIEEA